MPRRTVNTPENNAPEKLAPDVSEPRNSQFPDLVLTPGSGMTPAEGVPTEIPAGYSPPAKASLPHEY